MNIWETQKIIENEAIKIAKKYVSRPDVQEQIKGKALEAVGEVMDGLAKAVGASVENGIKCEYRKWVDKDSF